MGRRALTGSEWAARGWKRSDAQVFSGAPDSDARYAVAVWMLDAEPGELTLHRDKHNFIMNFVFVPREAASK